MTHKEFNENVLSSRDYVFTFLKKRFRLSNDLIEDIIQDSYVKAYSFLSENKILRSSFRTWICKVAFNMTLDKIRANKNKDFILSSQFKDEEYGQDFIDIQQDYCPEFSDLILNNIAQKELIDKIFNNMKLKHPEYYQTFMVYLDVDDYKQTSAIENIPIGTVKSRINKARKFVQENISEEDLLTLN